MHCTRNYSKGEKCPTLESTGHTHTPIKNHMSTLDSFNLVPPDACRWTSAEVSAHNVCETRALESAGACAHDTADGST